MRLRALGGQYAAAGKQYAVFIAIDHYPSWSPLRSPVRDAREIRDILTRRYYVDEVIELYDADATKAGIEHLFESLIERTAPEDSVLIFYAGHGYLNPGSWIPADGGSDANVEESWIPNAQIRRFISRMKARYVALISDSCFSGDIVNPTRGAPSDVTSEYFRAAFERVSRQVLTSGASESVEDASPFAAQLKLALEANRRPYFDLLMLYNEVRSGVTGSTPLFGALKEAGHQEGGSYLLFLRDAVSAPAARESATAADRIRIVVATDATWPPMEFYSEKREIVGYDIDVMNAVAEAAGLLVEYKVVAWDGIFAGLAAGSYDAIISAVTITDERTRVMDFSDPYINAGQILVVNNRTAGVENLTDLKGKTVGAQVGTTGAFAVDRARGVTLRSYDDISLAFQDLLSGRIWGFVCDAPLAALYALHDAKFKGSIRIVGEPLTEEYYGIVVRKGNDELLDLINSGLRTVRDSGTLEELEDRWLR